MIDPTDARRYLEAMLPLGHWQAASRAMGRNHAFIQRYIRRGVPRWLSECDRDWLTRTYPHLDAERLKPPSADVRLDLKRERTLAKQDKKPRIDSPILSDTEQMARRAELLRVWARIPVDKQPLALEGLKIAAKMADRNAAIGPSDPVAVRV